jgi:hypothetical protein
MRENEPQSPTLRTASSYWILRKQNYKIWKNQRLKNKVNGVGGWGKEFRQHCLEEASLEAAPQDRGRRSVWTWSSRKRRPRHTSLRCHKTMDLSPQATASAPILCLCFITLPMSRGSPYILLGKERLRGGHTRTAELQGVGRRGCARMNPKGRRQTRASQRPTANPRKRRLHSEINSQ